MGIMQKTGIITHVKREYETSQTGPSLASSLTKEGYNRFPGTVRPITPYKEKDGSYRTGLDENALYIKNLIVTGRTEEAEAEKARVREFLAHAQQVSGITDLGPRSDYFAKMYHEGFFGTSKAASTVKLKDGKNLFDLNSPSEALSYFWLRVHPHIAPSYEDYVQNTKSYRCPKPHDCTFYVEETDVETEKAYKKSILINSAISKLENMVPTRRFKIAKLLGLPVTYTTSESAVYVELDRFIKDTNKGGQKSGNLTLFNSILKISEQDLEIKYLLTEALELGVYRKGKGGVIYRGKTEMGRSEEDVIAFLAAPSNQEELLSIKAEISQKKGTLATSI